jgi:hypothetical protein
MPLKQVGWCAMVSFEANKYHAYARECLRQAETTDKAETREKLTDLSRVWMDAALNEERLCASKQGR